MEGVLGTVVWSLVIGVVIGALARLVLPGRQNISIVMTIVLGAVGALIGGLVAGWLGVGVTEGIDWIKLAIQVGVAAVAIVLYGSMMAKRGGTTPAT